MKIASIKKFHLNGETIVISYNADQVGDTSTPETYLEVTGLPEDSEVVAVGYTLNDSTGVPMKLADISNLGTADSITQDGLYLILSGALERLEISGNAECDIVMKQVI